MEPSLFSLGLVLIFLGFFLAFLATLLFFTGRARGARARGGGVIMIGPIPIVFGTDRESLKILIVLGLALTFLLIILTFFIR